MAAGRAVMLGSFSEHLVRPFPETGKVLGVQLILVVLNLKDAVMGLHHPVKKIPLFVSENLKCHFHPPYFFGFSRLYLNLVFLQQYHSEIRDGHPSLYDFFRQLVDFSPHVGDVVSAIELIQKDR